jgi:hypothetical protein
MMIFVESARLQAIAETIAAIQPCGCVTADEVKMALAAHDIYPRSILEDVLLEEPNAIAFVANCFPRFLS